MTNEATLPLRHALATLAYRAGKTIRDAPEGFSAFRPAEGSRSAGEILAHMCDLMNWVLTQANGDEKWNTSAVGPWNHDADRFFTALTAFDQYLASGEQLHRPPEQMFQGAVADALTHTGQIAMLRRMAGSRVMGENYSRAEIEIGRTGAEQAKPKREF